MNEMQTVVDPGLAVAHLVFKVADLKSSCQFYANLGLPAFFIEEKIAIIELRGGTHLVLLSVDEPDGQEFWNAGEYHEIVLHEKIVSSMYFSDSKGNKVEPAHYGIEHEAIDNAHDVVIFEDFGNGQTKLTFIGNETMENAKNSGQLEGWNQILDKVAAVVAGLAQAK